MTIPHSTPAEISEDWSKLSILIKTMKLRKRVLGLEPSPDQIRLFISRKWRKLPLHRQEWLFLFSQQEPKP